MADLAIRTGSLAERSRSWVGLSDEELRRAATRAARDRHADALWGLTEAHLYLHGGAGANPSRHTLRAYRRAVLDLLEAWQGETLLRPSRNAGPAYLRTLEGRGLAPASVRVKLAGARRLYAALRWAGATTATPFSDARAARDPTASWDKIQPYTDRELAQLLWTSAPVDRALLLLGAHAGLRISEILTLDWSHVDLPARRLTVMGGKGRKDRQVVLSRTLMQLLDTFAPKTGFVLPYRSPSNAARRLKRLCRDARVPYRGVHALRHTAGTRLARETGGNLEPVARHLGHATLTTARTYAHWSDEHLEESVGRW